MGWTGWIREVERNRDALERILALLFALAGLADRASSLPVPQRLHVICILGRAEARARAFVAGMVCRPSGVSGSAAFHAPDDAARLAASFRALALTLGALLAQAGRFSRLRGQFTYFPPVSAARPETAAAEISKLSPYCPLRHAARGPPPERVY